MMYIRKYILALYSWESSLHLLDTMADGKDCRLMKDFYLENMSAEYAYMKRKLNPTFYT